MRERRQIPIAELARKAGVSPTSIVRLEKGEVAEPSQRFCLQTASALEIPYSALFALTGWLPESSLPGSVLNAALVDVARHVPSTLAEREPERVNRRGSSAQSPNESPLDVYLEFAAGYFDFLARSLAVDSSVIVADSHGLLDDGDLDLFWHNVYWPTSETWLGVFYGLQLDPDEGFFLLGRLSNQMIELTGIDHKISEWADWLQDSSEIWHSYTDERPSFWALYREHHIRVASTNGKRQALEMVHGVSQDSNGWSVHVPAQLGEGVAQTLALLVQALLNASRKSE
jgi:transcriptional regulator with XRE-family HTH domain